MKLDQILKDLGSVKCDGNKDRVGIKGPLECAINSENI